MSPTNQVLMALDRQEGLSNLCIELMLEITSYLAPSDVLNLSLSCRSLHHHTGPSRQLHATAHKTYGVTSDLLPATALELLINSTRGGVEVWHVHEMEFWGSRQDWDDWKPWIVHNFETGHATDAKAHGPGLRRQDMQLLFEIASRWWKIPDDDFDTARNELEAGGDGFLKMLLIASCPRLHSLKFVERGLDMHTSLQWMTKATGWSKGSGNWPPGFQSLRDVAVGIPLRARTDPRGERPERRAFDFAGILSLPAIDRMYMRDLVQDFDEDDDAPVTQDGSYGGFLKYGLTKRGCAVKHIYLDSALNLSAEFHEILVTAAKDLVSMTIRGGEDHGYHEGIRDVDCIVWELANSYQFSMESLMLYNPLSLAGYRCGTYRPEELRNYHGLKQLSIGVSDVELDAYGDLEMPDEMGIAEFCQWLEDCEAFPSSMEALVLWEHPNDHHWGLPTGGPDSLEMLDEFLVALINQKQDRYTKLETIRVDIVERAAISAQRQTPCFQKAIAAGREAGVHVHTLTNRLDDGYWRKFPAAPDRFDLKSGLYGKRPEAWKINLATGIWEDPGCEGCGKCEECLRIYPEHVWKAASSS